MCYMSRDENTDLRTRKVISKVIVKMTFTKFVSFLHISIHEICKKFTPIVYLLLPWSQYAKLKQKRLQIWICINLLRWQIYANLNLDKFASLTNLIAKINFANDFAQRNKASKDEFLPNLQTSNFGATCCFARFVIYFARFVEMISEAKFATAVNFKTNFNFAGNLLAGPEFFTYSSIELIMHHNNWRLF